jgi:predicted ArsR family transcriptional regulator
MTRLDAIADPVRLNVVRHLSHAPGASLRDLAQSAGVHLNTARRRVAALEAAGVVEREQTAPAGRGRPRIGYRLARDWSPPTADFQGLAELLAAAVLRSGQGAEELRQLGLDWGRYLRGRPGAHDLEADLPRALERLGFHAHFEGTTLRLAACPCRRVAPDRPQLVCDLAAAVVDGVLAGSGGTQRVGARRHDTEMRRCSMKLEAGRRAGSRVRRAATRT